MSQTWDPKAYDENGSFVHELASGVFDWLAPQSGESILDVGCGDGQLTLRIAATGAKVQGVDSSAEMITAARLRGVHADLSPVELLPYADASFDAVFSNAALHWVRDQDAMMAQVHRVLKPGCRFVAELGGHGNIAAITTALRAVLARYGSPDYENGVNYYPTPEAYTRRLEKHGFRVEKAVLISRPTPLPESGMAGWLRTFRSGVLEKLPEVLRDSVVEETAALVAPSLLDEDGKWTADYVRLRFVAIA